MDSPEDLRAAARRARADTADLRRLAAWLDQSAIHELEHLGGDRTWVGPTAGAFVQAARQARQELAWASEGVRRHATVLEREAGDLERAAVRAEVTGAAAAAP